jgi:hypothetical protein
MVTLSTSFAEAMVTLSTSFAATARAAFANGIDYRQCEITLPFSTAENSVSASVM